MLIPSKINEIETISWDLILDTYSKIPVIPPIDLIKISDNLSLDIKFGNFAEPGIDGAFIRGKKTIYVNKNASYQRQSFTIAHEIGHFLLHDDKQQETFYRKEMIHLDSDKEQEQEANWFAASLLIPRELLIEYYGSLSSIQKVASAFMVSNSASYWRLKNLNLIK